MEGLFVAFEIHFARGRAGATSAFHHVADFGGVLTGEKILQTARRRNSFPRENRAERAVDLLNPAIGGNRDDAVRNALENRLRETATGLKLAAVSLQLAGHLIEAAYQARELIERAHFHAIVEIPFAHFVGSAQ